MIASWEKEATPTARRSRYPSAARNVAPRATKRTGDSSPIEKNLVSRKAAPVKVARTSRATRAKV
jgi:hypothetical protein